MKEQSISTPGRISLFGEHQNYLGLPSITAAISKRVKISGNHINENKIILDLPDIDNSLVLPLGLNLEYTDNWDFYKSSLNVLIKAGYTFSKGIHATINSRIPIKSGIASSTAIVVSWINFLSLMSDQNKKLNSEDIALLAYQAEIIEFERPGNIADHYSTAIGDVILIYSQDEVSFKKLNHNLKSFVLGNTKKPQSLVDKFIKLKEKTKVLFHELNLFDESLDLYNVRAEDIDKFNKMFTPEDIEVLKGIIINRDLTIEALDLFGNVDFDHAAFGKLLLKQNDCLRSNLKIFTPQIDRMLKTALDAGAYGGKINGLSGESMFVYTPEFSENVVNAIKNNGGDASIITVDKGTHIL